MNKQQSGFTLIELVVVIVILGILAATAVPRFANLTTDAETAACDGAIGALISSAAIQVGANSGSPVTRATVLANTDLTGGLTAAASGTAGVIDVDLNAVTCGSTPDLQAAGLTSD